MSTENRPMILVQEFDESKAKDYVDQLSEIENEFPSDQPVLVQIDSYGGEAYSLLMLLGKLKSMANPIITYTSSKAMSCGCILLSAGASEGMRYATPEAQIMIHEISTGVFGNINDIEDGVKYSKRFNTQILDLFAKSVGLGCAKDVRELIKSKAQGSDLELTAKQAKSLGFIDKVGYVKINRPLYWGIEVTS